MTPEELQKMLDAISWGWIPYVRQTLPGTPIELVQGDQPPLTLSDSQALFLAYQLLQCLMGNDQAKARANADRA
jgi:hypothetical protein